MQPHPLTNFETKDYIKVIPNLMVFIHETTWLRMEHI